MSEITYKNGKMGCVLTYWDEQGNIPETTTYNSGELIKQPTSATPLRIHVSSHPGGLLPQGAS